MPLSGTANSTRKITSESVVNAQRFVIARGAGNTTAATEPLVVQASQTATNNETLSAGVYVADAFIKNGSIVSV